MTELGLQIRQVRTGKNIRQMELAEVCGLNSESEILYL